MNLIRFFINQSKVVNLLVFFLTLWGLYIFIWGQKEGFPNITFPFVLVTTIYPGASPEEVESLITKKIEEAIKSVDGKKKSPQAPSKERALFLLNWKQSALTI